MELIKIPGKRGSSAPVLLTEEMTSAIALLLQQKHNFGVALDSPYVFPNDLSKIDEPWRGHDCIRKTAISVGVKFPERITSTKLRKYMATVNQIFELKEGRWTGWRDIYITILEYIGSTTGCMILVLSWLKLASCS
jgi:hypothetical protein